MTTGGQLSDVAKGSVFRRQRQNGQAGDPASTCDQYAALLPVRERVLGAEHPDTLTTRADLAYWIRKAGSGSGSGID